MRHPCKLVSEGNSASKKRFGLCDNLGSLKVLCYCCRKKDNTISEMAAQIGVGPSLFLMSTKAFAQFFLLISILYLPIFALYYYGDTGRVSNVDSIFVKLSLGNLGSSIRACG